MATAYTNQRNVRSTQDETVVDSSLFERLNLMEGDGLLMFEVAIIGEICQGGVDCRRVCNEFLWESFVGV